MDVITSDVDLGCNPCQSWSDDMISTICFSLTCLDPKDLHDLQFAALNSNLCHFCSLTHATLYILNSGSLYSNPCHSYCILCNRCSLTVQHLTIHDAITSTIYILSSWVLDLILFKAVLSRLIRSSVLYHSCMAQLSEYAYYQSMVACGRVVMKKWQSVWKVLSESGWVCYRT